MDFALFLLTSQGKGRFVTLDPKMAGYHRHLSLIVTFLTCFVLLFVAIIAIRTFVVSPRVLHFKSCKSNDDDFIKLDDVRTKRFQDSLRFRTVSYEKGKQNLDELLSFQKYIKSGETDRTPNNYSGSS